MKNGAKLGCKQLLTCRLLTYVVPLGEVASSHHFSLVYVLERANKNADAANDIA